MLDWEMVLPPSRPSATQLAALRSIIEAVDRSKPVAVLGSTPEFRDLLFECGFLNVHVLERNLKFLNEMSALRVHRNHEIVTEGNWLTTLPNMKGAFALILSDLTSGNISYEDRAQFYEQISAALMPGGIFCDKILTHPGPNIQVDALVEKYALLPVNLLYTNYFSCEMLFCSELLDQNLTVNSTHFYDTLDKRLDHPRVRAFMERAKKITPPGFTWWYGRKWASLRRSYCPDLAVFHEAEEDSGSPYSGRLKYYCFRKNAL